VSDCLAAKQKSCIATCSFTCQFRKGARLFQVEAAIDRLIKKHGRRDGDKNSYGSWADEVIKLHIYDNPGGKYLIKGGGPDVWKRFGIRKEHRRSQGLIFGKRAVDHREHWRGCNARAGASRANAASEKQPRRTPTKWPDQESENALRKV
jgi:hypothetical protein